jgi:hypothetical protein
MRKFDFSKRDKVITDELIEAGPKKKPFVSAKDNFIQEYIYQTEAYKEFVGGTVPSAVNNSNLLEEIKAKKEPLSFFNSYQHYGRINSQLMSIYPKDSILVNIGPSDDPVYVLDFVADAFEDLSLDIALFIQRNRVPQSSILTKISPQKGVDKVSSLYLNYSDQNYSYLLDFINLYKRNKDIYDVDSFIKVFADFIDIITPARVFTKSSFVSSRSCSFKTSGLVIDLFESDVNDDEFKFQKFIGDDYFSCYMDYIKERGFTINKDIPWQLIADLTSPRMKYYYNQRVKSLIQEGLLSEEVNFIDCNDNYEDCKQKLENYNLFENLINGIGGVFYYNIVNDNDLYELKRYIGKMYNSFVEYSPYYEQLEVKKNANKITTIKKSYERPLLNLDLFVEQPFTKNWVKLYVFIKAREANSNWTQKKFLDVVEKTYNLASRLDISEAMVYLQGEINNNKISTRKNTNFKF